MRDCRDGHSLSVTGRISVRWCPDCSRYEVRVWAVADSSGTVQTLIPEWAEVIHLPDDEWLDRTLGKYIRSLAATVRTIEEDERAGVMRLL